MLVHNNYRSPGHIAHFLDLWFVTKLGLDGMQADYSIFGPIFVSHVETKVYFAFLRFL